ncbi:sensor histidine kinase [Caballeronia sp. 15715]|uniref:sensor histidine kinase n=1 Tax=unclassified Caballeronia TaxID=2646786 RepID=UPI0039E452BB
MNFARKATLAASIDGLDMPEGAVASLAEVVRQHRAFADVSHAERESASFPEFLAHAAKAAAFGCNAPMAKILELRVEDRALIGLAHFGMGDDVIGQEVGKATTGNPPGDALEGVKPVAVADVRAAYGTQLPQIFDEYAVVSSVNVPLVGRDGAYGVLEVDYSVETAVGTTEISFLASVASVIADSIERRQIRARLTGELDSKVILLREQQHRIRNNFQLIIALLQRGARETGDQTARHGFEDVQRRVFAMASIYDHLLGLGDHGDRVDVSRYLGTMCDAFHDFYGLSEQGITLESNRHHGVMLSIGHCTAVGTAVNELVANCVEHAFGNGPGHIKVALTCGPDGKCAVTVSDDGCGVVDPARESTGLKTVRRLLKSVESTLVLEATPGVGTTWTIPLPAQR